MIRKMLIPLAAAGFALPAFADNTTSLDPAKSAAFSAELTTAAVAQQARLQLARQGYTNISALERDENGRWVGTAMKDGRTVVVGAVLPRPAQPQTAN